MPSTSRVTTSPVASGGGTCSPARPQTSARQPRWQVPEASRSPGATVAPREYYGPMIPRVMRLLRDGKYDDATEIYWQLHPARKVKSGLAAPMHGGFFLNRQAWKFQGWLQGYNGGPLRMPTQRIHDHQMAALRKGLLDAGLAPSMDPFREFFTGRHPD